MDNSMNSKNKTYDVCPYWMAFTFDNPIRKMFHNPEKMFEKYLKPNMNIMDFGCGMGYFSVALAKLTDDSSCIYSVDIQESMLRKVMKRAQYDQLDQKIKTYKCTDQHLDLDQKMDFILAFWMLHEVPDTKSCLMKLYDILDDQGLLFIAEPGFHVKKRDYGNMIQTAIDLGYKVHSYPKVRLSYAIVLSK